MTADYLPPTSPASAKPRASWIDFSRVIATILIIYFHLCSSYFTGSGISITKNWINSPLNNPEPALAFFFITAAYFTGLHISTRKLAGKIAALLIVYVVWNSLFALGLNDELSFSRVYGFGVNGRFPADYPLWFVRDVIIMLCMVPIFKRIPLLSSITFIALLIIYKNQWPWEGMHLSRIPSAHNFILFLLGLQLSRIPLEQLRARLQHPILIPLCIALITLGNLTLDSWQTWQLIEATLGALTLILIGIAAQRYTPRLCLNVAKAGPACFLIFAAHAGLILGVSLALQKLSPAIASNTAFVLSFPILIFGGGLLAFRMMRRRCPILLPFLALEGRLPFPKSGLK